MSRRTTLIRNRFLRRGKTVEDFIATKHRLVFRGEPITTPSAKKAFDIFSAAQGIHPDTRPMKDEKANRLRAYFANKENQ